MRKKDRQEGRIRRVGLIHSGKKGGRESPELCEGKEVVGWAGGHFSRSIPKGFFPLSPHHRTQSCYRLSPIYSSLFFYMEIFLISLVHRSWKRINRNLSKDLSIERSRSLSSSISISRYGRTLEACPRRRCPLGERKGAAILFLSSIVPIISLIPFCLFGAPGWFVSSSYLRNSLSSFVIILGERIGINFVEGRLWKGDSPFSIEVGKGVIDLFLNQALLTKWWYKLHCGWKEVLVSGATKGSSSSRNPLNRDWASKLFVYLILPGCETGREVNQVHVCS